MYATVIATLAFAATALAAKGPPPTELLTCDAGSQLFCCGEFDYDADHDDQDYLNCYPVTSFAFQQVCDDYSYLVCCSEAAGTVVSSGKCELKYGDTSGEPAPEEKRK